MQPLFILCTIVVGLLQLAYSWKGTVSNTNAALSIANNVFTDIGLLVTVTTTEENERLLISFMVSIAFPTALQTMRFMILRNGAQVATNQVRWVGAKYGGELQPVTVSILDTPGPINSYTIKVQAAGFGNIGNGGRIRQLSVVQFPASVSANYFQMTGAVNPPSVALDLSTAVTPSSITDKVLLLANLDAANVTAEYDMAVRFFRSGTALGTNANFALGSLISTPLSFLDEPSSVGFVTYSLQMGRAAASGAVVSAYGTPRRIAALVIPGARATSASVSSIFVISSVSWVPLSGLSLTVTTLSADDKVLLIFNGDHTVTSSTVTDFRLTILRNGVHLGDDTSGMLSINVGPSIYSKRSPMMVFMDPPGVGTFTYQVYALSGAGVEVQLGRSYVATQFAAILITSVVTPTAAPTPMLTAPPSRPPTANPSGVPTVVPTPAGTDCTVSCAVAGLGIIQVAFGANTGMYRLSPNFKLSFQIYGTTLSASASVRNNLFELIDAVNGADLLSMSMTETNAVQIVYNSAVVAQYAAILPSNYGSAWTLITITVEQNQLLVSSSTQGSFTFPIATVVDTSTRSYYLYTSNGYQTTGGGAFTTFSIEG
jgi:hypothetical protein